jgi:hypothetical protein
MGLIVLLSAAPIVRAAQSAEADTASVTSLIREMAGTWKVESRMWPGPHEKAILLPTAHARRELVRDTYLQEVMEPASESSADAFTRVAYFSYNAVNRQYEYFSLDSRLPQMMGYTIPGANKMREGKVELTGGSFVAPEWGARKNVPFVFRASIGPVEGDRQVFRLFLTEQGDKANEFLAFEYVYTRQR